MRETDLSEANGGEGRITTGLQCCLLCGRTLTNRALHDALEEQVLATIHAEHPEWSGVDEACLPCVRHYRSLLDERLTREQQVRARSVTARPALFVKLLDYRTRLTGLFKRSGLSSLSS